MKNCPNCSKLCSDFSKKCVYCDYSFDSEAQPTPQTEIKSPDSDKKEEPALQNEKVNAIVAEVNENLQEEQEPAESSEKPVKSYFDSIPEADMTESEARKLLLGDDADALIDQDDFGSVSNIFDEKDVLKKSASSQLLLYCTVCGIVSLVIICCVAFDYMTGAHAPTSINFDIFGYSIRLVPLAQMIVFALIMLAPLIALFGMLSLFVSSMSDICGSNTQAMIGSISAIKVGNILSVVITALVAVFIDLCSISYLSSNDTYGWIVFAAANAVFAISILYKIAAIVMLSGYKNTLDYGDMIQPPPFGIDVVNIVMVVLIALGGGWLVIDNLDNPMIQLGILACIMSVMFFALLEILLIKLRADMRVMGRISELVSYK